MRWVFLIMKYREYSKYGADSKAILYFNTVTASITSLLR
jgi:hypothetical protein